MEFSKEENQEAWEVSKVNIEENKINHHRKVFFEILHIHVFVRKVQFDCPIKCFRFFQSRFSTTFWIFIVFFGLFDFFRLSKFSFFPERVPFDILINQAFPIIQSSKSRTLLSLEGVLRQRLNMVCPSWYA